MTPEEFTAKVDEFAALVQAQHQERLQAQDYPFWQTEIVKVHKGHRYGTLDTIHEYTWGGYTARRTNGSFRS